MSEIRKRPSRIFNSSNNIFSAKPLHEREKFLQVKIVRHDSHKNESNNKVSKSLLLNQENVSDHNTKFQLTLLEKQMSKMHMSPEQPS